MVARSKPFNLLILSNYSPTICTDGASGTTSSSGKTELRTGMKFLVKFSVLSVVSRWKVRWLRERASTSGRSEDQ